MDLSALPELEELLSCSYCHLPFNETDFMPKLLTCRHYFCLKCIYSILQKGSELYCVHCWKRTELIGLDMKPDNLPTFGAIVYLTRNFHILAARSNKSSSKQLSSPISSPNSNNGSKITNSNTNSASSESGGNSNSDKMFNQAGINKLKKSENCLTHAMPNTLWCKKCNILVCRACAGSEDHRNHIVKNTLEAKESIRDDISSEFFSMQKTLNDIQQLVLKQRDFLLKILDSCTALKTQIETELINHVPSLEIIDWRESLCKVKFGLDMLDEQSPVEIFKFYSTLQFEKQRLKSRYQEMFVQCNLDDLIINCGVVFDFDLIKQALLQLHNCVINESNLDAIFGSNGPGLHHNPILLLANYCISQLYSRHVLSMKHQQLSNHQSQHIVTKLQKKLNKHTSSSESVVHAKTYADITTSLLDSGGSHHASNGTSTNSFGNQIVESVGLVTSTTSIRTSPTDTYVSTDVNNLSISTLTMMQHIKHSKHIENVVGQQSAASNTLLCNPSVHVYPIYYLNIDINGQTIGRILIETRNDVAPKMSKNFEALVTHELGFGYKGCQIFQCWENESIITGDFEFNNGRGGRSAFEEHFFMPDDTKILAIRGSVGMRRSQKRHDNMGLVGSQFRVILREMRGFTGIFAFVVEGIELVEKISQIGDSSGKPQSNIIILNCGKY